MTQPTIQFINHASYIIRRGDISILSDPWLFGSAFNCGWDLLCDSAGGVELFGEVSHVWFSHEHPDHFAPLVLKTVPEAIRRRVTVLFHESKDGEVVNYCRKLGFNVQVLPLKQKVALAPDLTITCGRVGLDDSWLLYECPEIRILNLNDCVIDDASSAASVASLTGTVDVLFTQFGYASWVGNPDERELRVAASRKKLECIKYQAQALNPRQIVPFASFVMFSHEENVYLNDGMNSIADAVRFVRAECGASPVALFPGDEWVPGTERDNTKTLVKYAAAEKEVGVRHRVGAPVPMADLAKLADAYREKTLKINARWFMRLLGFVVPSAVPTSVTMHLRDHGKTVRFSMFDGLSETQDVPDITLASDSLAYVFRHDFGADTLSVNGRFSTHNPAAHRRFFYTFRWGTFNNAGERLTPGLVVAAAVRRLKRA